MKKSNTDKRKEFLETVICAECKKRVEKTKARYCTMWKQWECDSCTDAKSECEIM